MRQKLKACALYLWDVMKRFYAAVLEPASDLLLDIAQSYKYSALLIIVLLFIAYTAGYLTCALR